MFVKLVTMNNLNSRIQLLPELFVDTGCSIRDFDISQKLGVSSSIRSCAVQPSSASDVSSKAFTEPTSAASCTVFISSEWLLVRLMHFYV